MDLQANDTVIYRISSTLVIWGKDKENEQNRKNVKRKKST